MSLLSVMNFLNQFDGKTAAFSIIPLLIFCIVYIVIIIKEKVFKKFVRKRTLWIYISGGVLFSLCFVILILAFFIHF